MRPDSEALVEATDEGLEVIPGSTVGIDSLLAATKTPHFGGQLKYLFLRE